MKDSPVLSTLLPDIFNASMPITTGSSPLIVSASLLFLEEVEMLPIVQGPEPGIDPETRIKMYATLGGFSVLKAIMASEPREYLKLLWTQCQEMPVWIGSVKFTDTLDGLLRVLERTKFGNAAIETESMGHPALVTLKDIVALFRGDRLKSNVRVSDIGSEKVSISSDSTITEALDLMFKKRIRRVFHSGNGLRFTSSRDIIRFLFSPHRLEIVKKTPELWLDSRLSSIISNRAESISDSATINQVSKQIGNKVDDCLVCEPSQKVVSRWDIVMKPWKLGEIE